MFALLVAACGPTLALPPDAEPVIPPGPDANTECMGATCFNGCPIGTQTTLSGVVTAPNGIDPVPGALVYVPLEVRDFPAEVACEVCNQITADAIVSTVTLPDGSFVLGPLPADETALPGDTVTIVSQKGRFRRVAQVPVANWCLPNTAPVEHFRLPPKDDGQFDRVPRIAVATGDYDAMECVLLKLGLDPSAFDLYAGARLGSSPLPGFDTLLRDPAAMRGYNVIFINCADNTHEMLLTDPVVRGNILDYVAAGGRLYVTDWSYDFVEQIDAFAPFIDFGPGMSDMSPETANSAAVGDDGITTRGTVHDPGLREWLEAVERRTSTDVIGADGRVYIEHFLNGWVMQYAVPMLLETAKVWITGTVSGDGLMGELPLTTTFDHLDCGRVLYSSYHTRGRDDFGLGNFPSYCALGEPLSPQERVLEYLILHIADCLVVD